MNSTDSQYDTPNAPANEPTEPTPPVAMTEAAAEEPRQGRALLVFGLIVIGAVILLYLAQRYASQQPLSSGAQIAKGEGTGQAAPDFTLKDIHGNDFTFAQTKGKVVLVNFWATWCGPCRVEMPWFIDFYKQYRGQGFEIVGIAMDDEGVSVVKPFSEELGVNYPIVLGNEDVATSFGGIFGLPTTFIVGRDGKIHAKHVGLASRDSFEEEIKKLL